MTVAGEIIEGDCIDAMRAMPEASVDAICTDPPYGLEFMGKEWDRLGALTEEVTDTQNRDGNWTSKPFSGGGQRVRYGASARSMQAWHEVWATEALRVLKPGGHLLAFGGTRTSHRLVCAIEDAGFEIRDTIAWMYGSGFPKSLDVSKAIDKAAGAARQIVGPSARHVSGKPNQRTVGLNGSSTFAETLGMGSTVTAPATPEAEHWSGWGTALKPAHEPIVVARKPLIGTVAANVLEHGTGALNVDGCRIEGSKDYGRSVARADGMTNKGGFFSGDNGGIKSGDLADYANPSGRWPANVVLNPEAAALLDVQTGELTSGSGPLNRNGDKFRNAYGAFAGGDEPADVLYGDTGGASRFFYVAKASGAERNAGLGEFEEKQGGMRNNVGRPLAGHDFNPVTRNVHPTVKPIALMRWLVRLVTPPGGTVLDPFAGSGTTGCAAMLEGADFVGIEREPEYAAIARARIAWWAAHPDGMDLIDRLAAEQVQRGMAEAGQLDLFVTPAAVSSGNGRVGESSADRRYTDDGASDFAMKPGRRRRD